MKYVRVAQPQGASYGLWEGDDIRLIDGDLFGAHTITDRRIKAAGARLLAPCLPSKAVCIGLNYHDHAREMKLALPAEPLMFLKPSSSLADPGGSVEYPSISQNLHYEAEMAIVIGKTARKVGAADAGRYILGYTCANDVTARDIQMKDGQWTRGKAFDTFLPLGPCIVTDIDPADLTIKLLLNDQVKQSSTTANLIFKVGALVAFASQVMTLYPGDVILTGTPAGVGPMEVGDSVTVEIAGIGRLTNTIVKG